MSGEEIRKHCNAYGYSDEEVGAFYDGYEKGREDAIDEVIKILSKDEDTILTDKQYYTLVELKGHGNE